MWLENHEYVPEYDMRGHTLLMPVRIAANLGIISFQPQPLFQKIEASVVEEIKKKFSGQHASSPVGQTGLLVFLAKGPGPLQVNLGDPRQFVEGSNYPINKFIYSYVHI